MSLIQVFRVTPEEREALHARAAAAGVSLQGLLRRMCGLPDTPSGDPVRGAMTNEQRAKRKADGGIRRRGRISKPQGGDSQPH